MNMSESELLLPNKVIEVPPETLAEIQRLYHEAFRLYGLMALWSTRQFEHPSAAAALAITPALRTHAGMAGRRLAEQIEAMCHATY